MRCKGSVRASAIAVSIEPSSGGESRGAPGGAWQNSLMSLISPVKAMCGHCAPGCRSRPVRAAISPQVTDLPSGPPSHAGWRMRA